MIVVGSHGFHFFMLHPLHMMNNSLIIGLCVFTAIGAMADVATPYPGEILDKQPDGRNATLFLRGHPLHGVFQTDQIGHPVVQDSNGWYVYASHEDTYVSPITGRRQLRPSNRVLGIHDPPQGEPPDLRQLSHQDLTYHELLRDPSDVSRSKLLHINDVSNEILCEGMPRTMWCPNNPVEIKSIGRNAFKNNEINRELNLIVILVQFSDQEDRPMSPASEYERLFIDPSYGPTGSVSKFFDVNSGGKLKIKVHVEDWTVSPNSEEYWSFGRHGLTQEFAAIANEGLNAMDRRGTDWSRFDLNGDGRLDGVFIIHSGYAAEVGGADGFTGKPWGTHRIWSQRLAARSVTAWRSANGLVRLGIFATTSAFIGSVSQMITRIGVVAHEIGHMLGLPDLLKSGEAGSGLGNYDIMGNMWGRDLSQFYPGIMSAWSRVTLGWAIPTELTVPGIYYISAALDDPNKVYKISHGFPDGEYLLIENRVLRSYDEQNYDEGLMVWHIDETLVGTFMESPGYPGQPGWPGNGNHYEIALLQADGSYGLEKGLDYGSNADLYKKGMADLSPSSRLAWATPVYPNTDAYSNGTVRHTGIRLSDFSDPGDVMSFVFSIDGEPPTPLPTMPPTALRISYPTRSPTRPPTAHPTPVPTQLPTNAPTPPPTTRPSQPPSHIPTSSPTPNPTNPPTHIPTSSPTPNPTNPPTQRPTFATKSPTRRPTIRPTNTTTPPTVEIRSPTLRPTLATPPPTFQTLPTTVVSMIFSGFRPTVQPLSSTDESSSVEKDTPVSNLTLTLTPAPTGATRRPTPPPVSLSPSWATDELWWERVSEAFVAPPGIPPLKRCEGKNNAPKNRSICSETPKTCLFGNQDCPDMGPSPKVQCVCTDSIWRCHEVDCSVYNYPKSL